MKTTYCVTGINPYTYRQDTYIADVANKDVAELLAGSAMRTAWINVKVEEEKPAPVNVSHIPTTRTITCRKATLFAMLAKNGDATFTLGGDTYILTNVEREDGSGQCFNLTARLYVAKQVGDTFTFFCRTVD